MPPSSRHITRGGSVPVTGRPSDPAAEGTALLSWASGRARLPGARVPSDGGCRWAALRAPP